MNRGVVVENSDLTEMEVTKEMILKQLLMQTVWTQK